MSIPFIRSAQLSLLEGVQHGFFTRVGGVSEGIYGGLNCGPFSKDDMMSVIENQRRVIMTLGGDYLVTNQQVHGNMVRVINENSGLDNIAQADGLVTQQQGICLGALGADCAPVLFADHQAAVIGVAHAGWQGAVKGVTDAVIDQMCTLGSTKDSIVASIGPAIQVESYEVGEEFRVNFLAHSSVEAAACFIVNDLTQNVHFDLPRYIELRLADYGVTAIDRCSEDTYAMDDTFFSYRRSCHRGESDYGRQIGAICLS